MSINNGAKLAERVKDKEGQISVLSKVYSKIIELKFKKQRSGLFGEIQDDLLKKPEKKGGR